MEQNHAIHIEMPVVKEVFSRHETESCPNQLTSQQTIKGQKKRQLSVSEEFKSHYASDVHIAPQGDGSDSPVLTDCDMEINH